MLLHYLTHFVVPHTFKDEFEFLNLAQKTIYN